MAFLLPTAKRMVKHWSPVLQDAEARMRPGSYSGQVAYSAEHLADSRPLPVDYALPNVRRSPK